MFKATGARVAAIIGRFGFQDVGERVTAFLEDLHHSDIN